MSYEQALEAAGAKVCAFESFGSYSGDWWALVEFNGARGWVNGYFGSCSGCDSFEAEFGYADEKCSEHTFNSKSPKDCEACADAAQKYAQRLKDFGADYLGNILTQSEAEAEASKNLEWDGDAQAMLDWIKANPA